MLAKRFLLIFKVSQTIVADLSGFAIAIGFLNLSFEDKFYLARNYKSILYRGQVYTI